MKILSVNEEFFTKIPAYIYAFRKKYLVEQLKELETKNQKFNYFLTVLKL